MTSSPGPTPETKTAISRADVPLLTAVPYVRLVSCATLSDGNRSAPSTTLLVARLSFGFGQEQDGWR